MKEFWKPVVGYEGRYEVSNMGRVRSLPHLRCGRTKVLRSSTTPNGYVQVVLCSGNNPKHKLVHRLVAEAFIDNPDSKGCVDHINADRGDNRAENLRWVTYTENNLNPITRKRLSECKTLARMSEETKRKKGRAVVQYDKDGNCLAEFWGLKEAQRQTGVLYIGISACCRGISRTAGGYIWKYKDNRYGKGID